MTGFVAMLRGINVGGRNMVKMDALKALHESLGFAAELREAVKANPLPQRLNEPNAYVIAFLSAEPADPGALDAYTGPEEMRLLGRELYIYYGEGMGRSKLTNTLIERKLGVRATARNWNTVTKLLELCEALEKSRKPKLVSS